MKTKSWLLKTLCLSACLVLALSGCAKQPATVWEQIQADGKITVGTSPDYPPFEMVDDDGTIIGFDIDLINAMAAEMGVEVELKSMSFDTIITAVQSGQVNIGMAGFSIDPEHQVDFTDPYYSGGQVVLTTADSGIKDIADLAGQTVAVQMGTTGEKAAQNIAGANLKALESFEMAILMLQNGTAKAVVADKVVAKGYEHEKGMVIVGEPLANEDNAIIIKEGNEDLTQALNEALAKVKENGKYDELLQKWGIK